MLHLHKGLGHSPCSKVTFCSPWMKSLEHDKFTGVTHTPQPVTPCRLPLLVYLPPDNLSHFGLKLRDVKKLIKLFFKLLSRSRSQVFKIVQEV